MTEAEAFKFQRDEARAELVAAQAEADALREQMARLAEQHVESTKRLVAEAREEQNEACWRSLSKFKHTNARIDDVRVAVRATPLDSTPLADALAAANEEVRTLTEECNQLQADLRDSFDLREKTTLDVERMKVEALSLKAERHAFGMKVAEKVLSARHGLVFGADISALVSEVEKEQS